MFIQQYENYKTDIQFSTLEKQALKEEIQNIMKKGGKFFTYEINMYNTGTHSRGSIYDANYHEIGEVIGILPICLRAICGNTVKGIKLHEDGVFPYVDENFYPLDECLKFLD